MIISDGNLDDQQVVALLAFHLAEARASTPQENAHALGVEELRSPAITFRSAWDGTQLVGVAALREIEASHGEVKSMRTHPAHLRCGVARLLLDDLIGVARAREYRQLSLETGTAPMFAAANALYEAAGCIDGPVFGGYLPSPHNRFMTLTL